MTSDFMTKKCWLAVWLFGFYRSAAAPANWATKKCDQVIFVKLNKNNLIWFFLVSILKHELSSYFCHLWLKKGYTRPQEANTPKTDEAHNLWSFH